MSGARTLLAAPLALLLLAGCASSPQAEVRGDVEAVLAAANDEDAEAVRSAVDELLATLRDQVGREELTAAQAEPLRQAALAVRDSVAELEAEPTPTPTPTPTPEPEPTQEPSPTPTPEPTEEPVVTEEPEEPVVTEEPEEPEEPEQTPPAEDDGDGDEDSSAAPAPTPSLRSQDGVVPPTTPQPTALPTA